VIALAIVVAGGIGALARGEIAHALRSRAARPLPVATLAVNVVGSFALGWVVSQLDVDGRAIWGTGFCGGLTTYSTLAVETLDRLRAGHRRAALGYALTSLLLGTLAAVSGFVVGGTWR
jgi:fluoride exporter